MDYGWKHTETLTNAIKIIVIVKWQLHKRTVQLEINRLEKPHWIVNQG